jgi:hypothetical protein
MTPLSPQSSSIFPAFKDLKDSRKKRNQLYSLLDIITVSILGLLCGANDWVVVNIWASCHLKRLQEHGFCQTGVPSHDTLGRIFRYVDPAAFLKNVLFYGHKALQKASRGLLL